MPRLSLASVPVDAEAWILVLRVGLVLLLYAFLLQVLVVVWRDLRGSAPETLPRHSGDEPAAQLVVLDGAGTGLAAGTAFLLAFSSTVGRIAPNTVVLPDPGVSARHARIARRQGQWVLEDLGSANGTCLNGTAVERAVPVGDGDEIEIAQVKLRMEIQ